jgi:hypothetical protein
MYGYYLRIQHFKKFIVSTLSEREANVTFLEAATEKFILSAYNYSTWNPRITLVISKRYVSSSHVLHVVSVSIGSMAS